MNGQKFSLSFSKRIEKKSLQPSALGSEGKVEVKQTPQALLAVDQDSLKVNENAEEEELVIPLLQAKRSAVLSRLAKLQLEGEKETEEKNAGQEEEKTSQATQEDSKPLTLEEKAERALLEESKRKLDEWTTRDVKKDITIPATQNEDPLSAPLVDIGKESSLDDYDQIGVESFGAAVLRGMGWKKSEGIGGRGKKVIEIIDPSSKTLGSSEGKQDTGKKKEGEGEEEEELPIVKGAYVFLHSGRHRGTYGVVEVMDEDHLLIRTAMGQTMLREVEGNLRVTTQKEYRESSRVINKEMYDKFKEAEIKKNEAKKRMRHEEDEEDSGTDRDRKTTQKTKSRDREESHRVTSSRGTTQRNTDSESAKVKHESSEEEKYKMSRERDSERHREKNERLRDEPEARPREKNSEKQKERDYEKYRDRDEDRQRHREKEAERQKYKESRQEYTREEKKDRSRDYRESGGRTQDPQSRPYKDTLVPVAKRKHEESIEAQSKMKTKQQKTMAPPWVRENLRVRIINKNYKGGKYHKEKVVVVSVVTAESCECVAEGGRLLGGVDPAWLETVIPKQPPMVVMVVRGRHNGQKGRILQLHKEQEKASIQLLEDETTILKLHYDDICEYVLR